MAHWVGPSEGSAEGGASEQQRRGNSRSYWVPSVQDMRANVKAPLPFVLIDLKWDLHMKRLRKWVFCSSVIFGCSLVTPIIMIRTEFFFVIGK